MRETTELHRRTIEFDVTRAADGRAVVRGELVDLRQVAIGRHLGKEHPAGVVHHMGLEVTVDADRIVRTADAWMKTAPFEPSPRTAGEGCRHVLPNYQRLVGVRLDEAYAARVLEEIGGVHGCFHILSLAQCLPFAFLASSGERSHRLLETQALSDEAPGFRLEGRLVDRSTSAGASESKLSLDLEFPGFRIRAARAEGPRAERAEVLADLVIAKGFTGTALARLGDASDLVALVVAMSPITAQASGSYAALLGFDLRPRSRSRAANPQIDSCHMWRSEGPLVALVAREASKGDAG